MKRLNNSSELYLVIILRILLLIFGLIGQKDTLLTPNFMSSTAMMYYTNQSNWVVMIITLVFLIFDFASLIRAKAFTPPAWLYSLKFIATAGICVTFLVFSLLLTPQMIAQGNVAYLKTTGNICVHNLVPLLCLADWFITKKAYKHTKNAYMLATVMPICYMAYVFVCNLLEIHFGSSAKVPYFFFDYEQNGWLTIGSGKIGVVWWIIILTAAVLIMGRILLYKGKMKKTKEEAR